MSPWARFVTYRQYWTGSGSSSPYRSLKAATAAGSPAACSPRFATTGSLGTSCVKPNATRVIPRRGARAPRRA